MKAMVPVFLLSLAIIAGRPAAWAEANPPEVIARLFGKTVVAMRPDGTRVHYFVEPGGTLTMRSSSGSADSGTWRVQERTGLVCVTWQKLRADEELCSAFRLDGDNLVQMDQAGTVLNTAKVVPGRLATF